MLVCNGVSDFKDEEIKDLKEQMIASFHNKEKVRADKLPLFTFIYRTSMNFLTSYVCVCWRRRISNSDKKKFFEK